MCMRARLYTYIFFFNFLYRGKEKISVSFERLGDFFVFVFTTVCGTFLTCESQACVQPADKMPGTSKSFFGAIQQILMFANWNLHRQRNWQNISARKRERSAAAATPRCRSGTGVKRKGKRAKRERGSSRGIRVDEGETVALNLIWRVVRSIRTRLPATRLANRILRQILCGFSPLLRRTYTRAECFYGFIWRETKLSSLFIISMNTFRARNALLDFHKIWNIEIILLLIFE